MNYTQTFPTPAEHTPGKNTCKYIVLHHTGTKEGTIKGVLDGLNKRVDYASCHYCVDVNGDVYKMGNDTDILWHAGVSSWKGLSDLNNHSIGIETIGPMSNGGFTDKQRKAIAELILHLCSTHNLKAEHVLRHKDIAPTRKVDIADTFWNGVASSWEDWKKIIFAPTPPTPQKDEVSTWALETKTAAINKGVMMNWDNCQHTITPKKIAHIFYNLGFIDMSPDNDKSPYKHTDMTEEQFVHALHKGKVF